MEDYEYKVSNYMQLYPMNISKLTGNVSRNTSKSTSETNQMRLGGVPSGPWAGEYTRERLVRRQAQLGVKPEAG